MLCVSVSLLIAIGQVFFPERRVSKHPVMSLPMLKIFLIFKNFLRSKVLSCSAFDATRIQFFSILDTKFHFNWGKPNLWENVVKFQNLMTRIVYTFQYPKILNLNSFSNSLANSFTKSFLLDIKFHFTCSQSNLGENVEKFQNLITKIR